jgi:hypothetical protein
MIPFGFSRSPRLRRPRVRLVVWMVPIKQSRSRQPSRLAPQVDGRLMKFWVLVTGVRKAGKAAAPGPASDREKKPFRFAFVRERGIKKTKRHSGRQPSPPAGRKPSHRRAERHGPPRGAALAKCIVALRGVWRQRASGLRWRRHSILNGQEQPRILTAQNGALAL